MAELLVESLETAAAWLAGIVAVLLIVAALIGVVLVCERDDFGAAGAGLRHVCRYGRGCARLLI